MSSLAGLGAYRGDIFYRYVVPSGTLRDAFTKTSQHGNDSRDMNK